MAVLLCFSVKFSLIVILIKIVKKWNRDWFMMSNFKQSFDIIAIAQWYKVILLGPCFLLYILCFLIFRMCLQYYNSSILVSNTAVF